MKRILTLLVFAAMFCMSSVNAQNIKASQDQKNCIIVRVAVAETSFATYSAGDCLSKIREYNAKGYETYSTTYGGSKYMVVMKKYEHKKICK